MDNIKRYTITRYINNENGLTPECPLLFRNAQKKPAKFRRLLYFAQCKNSITFFFP